jgi:hypothetical protein
MDFAGMIETWRRVLTQPGEPVFLEEKNRPQATLQTALIWMLIAGVVAAIFGFLQSVTGISSIDAILSQADLPPEVAAQMAPFLGAAVGGAGFAAIITVPVFFLIGSFIYHLLATMFGGQGDYGKFAYLMSTYQAPIAIANSIISIIPFLGGCVAFLLTIYAYVETYFAVRANYGLPNGRALAVVLIPVALIFLIFFCVFVVLIGSIATLRGS